MPFFSRKKDKVKSTTPLTTNGATKPKWEDSWLRTRVDPEEVSELLSGCTAEIKARALDVPFLLLPFRPSSDPSAARTFVRNYFYPPSDRKKLTGASLTKELRMTEVMVIVAVMKWCWARLPGGVVSWEAYQGFKMGEKGSRFARNSFNTFIPISVSSKARVQIINDFFDLLAALAAHGKSNGLGGIKLSRFAGWWAFEHFDTGKGFDAGYKLWDGAASATSHLFFAYLRSQSPEPGVTNGILDLPRSLQQLLDSVDYPPQSDLLNNDTTKVVMVVDVVSPTPFALLRRAKNFQYRDDDLVLQRFSEFEDPVSALTEECRRVLRAISSTNQSHVSDAKTSTSLKDPSWSRFEDIGFGSAFDDVDENSVLSGPRSTTPQMMSTMARSPFTDLNRPTTPSWADFLSSGFVDENGRKAPSSVLLPPDKALPPISTVASRGQSSQSHRRDIESSLLEPGEIASIVKIELDDAFWWVWMSSLAGEEPVARKAAFGRCALIETSLLGGQWLVMEEQVKGAAPDPIPGAYVAERKGFFSSFTKKGRLTRRKSALKKSPLIEEKAVYDPANRLTLDSERQVKIQKAAAELARKQTVNGSLSNSVRRGRMDENVASKTNSVFTLGPMIKDEASPALQWAAKYDKKTIRAQYLGDTLAGKGSRELLTLPNGGVNRSASTLSMNEKALPPAPGEPAMSEPTTRIPVDNTVNVPTFQEQNLIAVPAVVQPDRTHDVVTHHESPAPLNDTVHQSKNDQPEPITAPSMVPQPIERVESPSHTTTSLRKDSKVESLVRPSSRTSTGSSRSGRNKNSSDGRLKKFGLGGSSAPPPVSTNKVSGMKKLFGTMRKKDELQPAPVSPTLNEDSAVARARRALEGKARPGDNSRSPPLSPNHFKKMTSVNRAMPEPSAERIEPQPVGRENHEPMSNPVLSEATMMPTATQEPTLQEPALQQEFVIHEPPFQEPRMQESIMYDVPNGIDPVEHHEHHAVHDIAPDVPDHVESALHHPNRAYDHDELSRIDSREMAAADREFSRFDQGPLTDQPAFYPVNDVVEEEEEGYDHSFEPPHRPQHQSIYSAVTMETDVTEDEPTKDELTQQVSANDRWAQIRRNAAERAARASEDHTRSRTETRTTDDGETSGEETIESRVARIKARVAELTGNMEGVRR